MKKRNLVEAMFAEISRLPQVEAIALGGSRAGCNYDEKSDYDIYIYITELVPEEKRRTIFDQYCSYMEYGNHYWELGDDGTLSNGIDVDILYRNLDAFEMDVKNVVINCQPSNAYTTCMWHNLITCKIVYDRDKRLKICRKQCRILPKDFETNLEAFFTSMYEAGKEQYCLDILQKMVDNVKNIVNGAQ